MGGGISGDSLGHESPQCTFFLTSGALHGAHKQRCTPNCGRAKKKEGVHTFHTLRVWVQGSNRSIVPVRQEQRYGSAHEKRQHFGPQISLSALPFLRLIQRVPGEAARSEGGAGSLPVGRDFQAFHRHLVPQYGPVGALDDTHQHGIVEALEPLHQRRLGLVLAAVPDVHVVGGGLWELVLQDLAILGEFVDDVCRQVWGESEDGNPALKLLVLLHLAQWKPGRWNGGAETGGCGHVGSLVTARH
mmetsp:Transcript_16481/g.29311  ORF Transcript_16481/g.29311 Transcript_16481/m.29311 type:complete len:245 (-) Transcript_16481:552-1286(-)